MPRSSRIRQLVDLAAGPRPLLFLLDEIFHGTNSHDRVAGAEAVVRGLIDRGAIGLVTTHDLALAEVAEGLAPRARTSTSRTSSSTARCTSTTGCVPGSSSTATPSP